MSKDNKWSEIENELIEVSKKIKNKIDEEDLVLDLKDSFKQTIENTADIIKNITITLDTTIKDIELKKETKKIIKEINFDLKNLVIKSGNNLSKSLNFDYFLEEE